MITIDIFEKLDDFLPKRAITVGDLHSGYNANSNEWFNHLKRFFVHLVNFIDNTAKEGDIIVFLGDINDNNQIIRVEIHDYLINTFEIIGKKLPVFIIIGNHDIVKKYSNTVNGVNAFDRIHNVHVLTNPTYMDSANGRILFMPWCHGPELEKEIVDKADDGCWVFSHTHTDNMIFNDEFVFKNKQGDVLSNKLTLFDKFKRMYNGHIHRYQDYGVVLNVGAIMQMKFVDSGNKSGFMIIGFESEKEIYVDVPDTPTFETIDLFTFIDLTIAEANKIVNNAYVKIIYPINLRSLLHLEVIRQVVEGYLSLDFDPVGMKSKVDVKKRDVQLKAIDLKEKISVYLNEELICEDGDKNGIKKEILELYDKAHIQVVKEEDFE